MKGHGLSASTRWSEALKEIQYRNRTRPTSRQARASISATDHDRARQNWKRIGAIAQRAGADDSDTEVDDNMTEEELKELRRKKHEANIEREKLAKQMDLQYWLEYVRPNESLKVPVHLLTFLGWLMTSIDMAHIYELTMLNGSRPTRTRTFFTG